MEYNKVLNKTHFGIHNSSGLLEDVDSSYMFCL